MNLRLAMLTVLVLDSGCDSSRRHRAPTAAASAVASAVAADGSIRVEVDAAGYHPAKVKAPAGKPAKLVFRRTSEEGCGEKLVFPALGITKDLPLGVDVAVELTMPATGSLAFTCGMDMYRGSVVAE